MPYRSYPKPCTTITSRTTRVHTVTLAKEIEDDGHGVEGDRLFHQAILDAIDSGHGAGCHGTTVRA